MSKLWQRIRFLDSKGQSLVETALFLPIMIVMLLGIVEVSTLLINQNRVTTAGRIAAGYGATKYDGTNWETVADDMGIVAWNTVTDTLNMDEDLWDVWSVYAKVNSSGTDFDVFLGKHAVGGQRIVSQTDWDTSVKAEVRSMLLAELQSSGGDISGLEFVVSIPYHDSATFLNLPIWQWSGFKTISGLTAMRVDRPVSAGGCTILPITVRLNQYSVYPTNWNSSEPHPEDEGSSIPLFPAYGTFQDRTPSNPAGWQWPRYENLPGVTAPNLDTATFTNNVPGRRFASAQTGYVYYARENTNAGGFGWLTWDGSQDATALLASIRYAPPPPGNFHLAYPGSDADRGLLPTPSQSGNNNGMIEINEWLQVSTGNVNSVADQTLTDYVFTGRPVTMIYYDTFHGGAGNNTYIQVKGFATVKILGLDFTAPQGQKWILFEFLGWSIDCM
jgi:hypothetical protein